MNRVKNLRKQRGVTQTQLAASLGVSRSTVAMWEIGKSDPDTYTLKVLSDYFNVSIDHILCADEERKNFIRVPVLGSVPAGFPIEAVEDVIDWEDLGPEYLHTGYEYFGLRIQGDSMEPVYLNGDTIIVRQQPTADTGDDAVVFVNGDYEATFKRIRRDTKGIMLRPLNSKYEPTHYSNKEIMELPIQICGIAVELRRSIK